MERIWTPAKNAIGVSNMNEEQHTINKAILELIAKQELRIKQLETDVKRLQSKNTFRSLGKGKNLETPSIEKVIIAR